MLPHALQAKQAADAAKQAEQGAEDSLTAAAEQVGTGINMNVGLLPLIGCVSQQGCSIAFNTWHTSWAGGQSAAALNVESFLSLSCA
jgi:hypothetical protein